MSHRPSSFTTGDARLVHSGIHSQLSGPHPAPRGAVCTFTAKTEIPQSVSWFPTRILGFTPHTMLLHSRSCS